MWSLHFFEDSSRPLTKMSSFFLDTKTPEQIMNKTHNQDYIKFEQILEKLRDEGKISDEPPPQDREGRREYIKRLTGLFKESFKD